LQCFGAGVLLWAIIASSISAGSFPPKELDDSTLLFLYGIILWSVLALVAGVAILLKKTWGWWLEFSICAPPVFIYLAYMWIRGDRAINSFQDWITLFGALMVSAFAIHSMVDLYKKARRETQSLSKPDVPLQ
jgi:hypothetical protein